MTAISDTFLKKSATDAGFDIPADKEAQPDWLQCRSCRFNLVAWIRGVDSEAIIALSEEDVFKALAKEFSYAETTQNDLPQGAAGAIQASSTTDVHEFLARSAQLETSLPDRIADAFVVEIGDMPRETEAERLVVQRKGQSRLRAGLLDYWNGNCVVTGLDLPEALRASHIKPWSKCANDRERLNLFNALLLAAHLDALFDQGFITFGNDGNIQISGKITAKQRQTLGLTENMKLCRVEDQHCSFLDYHRTHVFKK